MKINDKAVVVLVLVLLFGAVWMGCAIYLSTETVVTARVAHKERVGHGSGENFSEKYLVYTDGETFELVDSLLYLRFNSSDHYGNIREGQTYRLRVVGWRVPFLSWYRNVIQVEPIEP